MEIEQIPITEVIPYENNPRKNDKAVDVVAKSITEFGFKVPIIIDENNVIIAGHTRLKAAYKLGIEEVPILRADDLTPEQVKAFRIMDNKSTEFSFWHDDLLKGEFQQLDDAGFDVELTGFSFKEVGDLLGKESEEDDFEVPKEAKYKIEQGEIWQLGDHRLMCGDATKEADVGALMAGNKANMVFTDPPYNVDFQGSVQSDGRKSHNSSFNDIKNDKMSDEEWEKFLKLFITNQMKYCEGVQYICMSCKELHNLTRIFIEMGGRWSNYIMWLKNKFAISRKDYNNKYEPLMYGWRKDIKHYYCGDNSQTDVWEINRTNKNDLHPTMKPLELCAKAINNSSLKEGIVLDLFGGSGSTLIACEQTKRKCYMMELDPFYCSVIIERWEKLKGKQATKVNK